jgi:hypothetical protein
MVGSGIRKKPIPDPGSRIQGSKRYRIRIRNTGSHQRFQTATDGQLARQKSSQRKTKKCSTLGPSFCVIFLYKFLKPLFSIKWIVSQDYAHEKKMWFYLVDPKFWVWLGWIEIQFYWHVYTSMYKKWTPAVWYQTVTKLSNSRGFWSSKVIPIERPFRRNTCYYERS